MHSWSLAIIAALVLGYAGLSRRLERTLITAPMLFVAAGFLVGPEAFGWLDLGVESGAVQALAEATLTLVLFADASRIDLGALRREVALPARLLGLGLPLTIAAGTMIAVLVFSQLTWLEALVLAIVLAPTDAALGQAVVTDRRLPVRIRQGLNAESGLNDGICVPLLFISARDRRGRRKRDHRSSRRQLDSRGDRLGPRRRHRRRRARRDRPRLRRAAGGWLVTSGYR